MIVLEFTKEQLNTLSAALAEIPFKHAAPLISHINAQLQKQFDTSVDARNMPPGATRPPDEFSGD
jgi:hypothetical protein